MTHTPTLSLSLAESFHSNQVSALNFHQERNVETVTVTWPAISLTSDNNEYQAVWAADQTEPERDASLFPESGPIYNE